MTAELLLPLISRWAHIISALLLGGGVLFVRFALNPALRDALNDEQRDGMSQAVWSRWKMVIHISAALLVLSGLYNYVAVGVPAHRGDGLYHGLFGLKFLFGLAAVGLAALVATGKPKTQSLLTPLVVLIVIVVLLGGVMKIMPATIE